MSRHYERVNQDEFINKLFDVYVEAFRVEEDEKYVTELVESCKTVQQKLNALYDASGDIMRNLTPKIAKDFEKVEFDLENFECNPDRDWPGLELTGIRDLGDGLTVFGMVGGGDWEWPVYFFIYWNGVSFRGYIPKHGNAWNHKTKSAIGNHDEEDIEFLMKLTGNKDIEFADQVKTETIYHRNQMVADIKARIKEQVCV